MMKDMLKPEYIFTDVAVPTGTKEEALSVLSGICADRAGFDQTELLKTFTEREAMDSTGFGNGVAIPHAKIQGLTAPMVGIFRFASPVEWEAIDDEPVNVAIALVMPGGDESNTHLQVISQFARLLVHDEFVEALTTTKDSTELYTYILNQLEA